MLFNFYNKENRKNAVVLYNCINCRVTVIRCHIDAVGVTDYSNTSAVGIVT